MSDAARIIASLEEKIRQLEESPTLEQRVASLEAEMKAYRRTLGLAVSQPEVDRRIRQAFKQAIPQINAHRKGGDGES